MTHLEDPEVGASIDRNNMQQGFGSSTKFERDTEKVTDIEKATTVTFVHASMLLCTVYQAHCNRAMLELNRTAYSSTGKKMTPFPLINGKGDNLPNWAGYPTFQISNISNILILVGWWFYKEIDRWDQ